MTSRLQQDSNYHSKAVDTDASKFPNGRGPVAAVYPFGVAVKACVHNDAVEIIEIIDKTTSDVNAM